MKKLSDILSDTKALSAQYREQLICQEAGCEEVITTYCDCLMGLCEKHLQEHIQTQRSWEQEVADKLGVPLRQVRGFTVPQTGMRACEYEANQRAKQHEGSQA